MNSKWISHQCEREFVEILISTCGNNISLSNLEGQNRKCIGLYETLDFCFIIYIDVAYSDILEKDISEITYQITCIYR